MFKSKSNYIFSQYTRSHCAKKENNVRSKRGMLAETFTFRNSVGNIFVRVAGVSQSSHTLVAYATRVYRQFREGTAEEDRA